MINVSQIDPFSLPSLPIADRGNMPNISAVYFAISKDKNILYVGKALFLKARWTSHDILNILSKYDGVSIAWLALGSISGNGRAEKNAMGQKLGEIEEACIDFFNPPFNHTRLSTGVPKSTIEQVDEIMMMTGMSKRDVFVKAFEDLYQTIKDEYFQSSKIGPKKG